MLPVALGLLLAFTTCHAFLQVVVLIGGGGFSLIELLGKDFDRGWIYFKISAVVGISMLFLAGTLIKSPRQLSIAYGALIIAVLSWAFIVRITDDWNFTLKSSYFFLLDLLCLAVFLAQNHLINSQLKKTALGDHAFEVVLVKEGT
jgi:hypothetical protein